MSTQKKGFLGLGTLFRNLKNKLIMDVISQFFTKLFEKLKAKNKKVFAAIFTIASILQFGAEKTIEAALSAAGFIIDLPVDFLSLTWILANTPLELNDMVIKWIMWIAVAITGVHTTEFLPPEVAEKKLTRAERRAQRQDEKLRAKQQF